jgi:hypothetical protein
MQAMNATSALLTLAASAAPAPRIRDTANGQATTASHISRRSPETEFSVRTKNTTPATQLAIAPANAR